MKKTIKKKAPAKTQKPDLESLAVISFSQLVLLAFFGVVLIFTVVDIKSDVRRIKSSSTTIEEVSFRSLNNLRKVNMTTNRIEDKVTGIDIELEWARKERKKAAKK